MRRFQLSGMAFLSMALITGAVACTDDGGDTGTATETDSGDGDGDSGDGDGDSGDGDGDSGDGDGDSGDGDGDSGDGDGDSGDGDGDSGDGDGDGDSGDGDGDSGDGDGDGGLGAGEICQDMPDACAPGLLCCYPCGIPDCQDTCMEPDPNTNECPLFP